jgi:hydrogenase maturation factor
MCFTLPYKVISSKKRGIELDFFGKKRRIKRTLIKVKAGDFVLVQKDTIIRKVPKKETKEILKLILKNEKRRE